MIDWYNNNIWQSLAERPSQEVNPSRYTQKGVKQGHFGAVPNYASSRIPFKKLIGLQDSAGEADLSVGTIIGDDLIQATTRNGDT